MTTPRLSPAQRNLLRKLISGTSAMQGAGRTSKAAAGPTFRALVQRDLVREDLSVTDAGRAVFAPVKALQAAQAGVARLAVIAGVLAIALALSTSHMLDGPTDITFAQDQASDQQAAREDAAALASREWAATQVCGPHAVPTWLGDRDLQCTPAPVLQAAAQ